MPDEEAQFDAPPAPSETVIKCEAHGTVTGPPTEEEVDQ